MNPPWIAISLTANGLGPFQDLALSENGTPLRTLQLVSIVLAVTVQSVCLLVHRNLRHGRTLAVQQALLDAVIEGSPVAPALLDADQPHRIVRANRAFRDLLPAAQSDVRQCFVGSEGDALVRLIASVQTGDDAVSGEFTTTDSDGRPLLLRMRVAAVVADEFDRYGTLRSGANVTRVLHAEDITDVRSREHRLRHYATTDELTGLANRRQLLHVLHASLTRVSQDHQLAVAYLDLDGFKQINDRHGHATGDGVLQDVADCLRDSVRPTDLVARAGGDEFVIVSLNLPNSDVAVTQAQRVLARLADIPTSPEPLRASIGIAVTDDPHRPAEDLLRVADRRMYQAKASGGGIVAI